MVKCDGCGLVRADPAVDPQVIADLYSKSGFDYAEEVANLKRTYGRYLRKVDDYVESKGSLLEIGCGNGFFLEKALSMGYKTVMGIEPSMKAIEASNPSVRPTIICDIMRPGLFGAEEFDVICMFQLLDHISDPTTFLRECFKVLKPGGVVLSINHNVKALSARLLGKASPIVDIEHTFLFSKITIARLFGVHKFEVKQSGLVLNSYTIKYLVHLAPIASLFKQALLSVLVNAGLGRIGLSLPLGNLYLIAQKPAT
jgi:SAM-dependent methyltransferase